MLEAGGKLSGALAEKFKNLVTEDQTSGTCSEERLQYYSGL